MFTRARKATGRFIEQSLGRQAAARGNSYAAVSVDDAPAYEAYTQTLIVEWGTFMSLAVGIKRHEQIYPDLKNHFFNLAFHFCSLAAKDNRRARWDLGMLYLYGIGTPRDLTQAEQLLSEAGIGNRARSSANLYLGLSYIENGHHKKAWNLFELIRTDGTLLQNHPAAAQAIDLAQFRMQLYGLSPDQITADKLITQLEQHSSQVAQGLRALMQAAGLGVAAADEQKAAELFGRISAQTKQTLKIYLAFDAKAEERKAVAEKLLNFLQKFPCADELRTLEGHRSGLQHVRKTNMPNQQNDAALERCSREYLVAFRRVLLQESGDVTYLEEEMAALHQILFSPAQDEAKAAHEARYLEKIRERECWMSFSRLAYLQGEADASTTHLFKIGFNMAAIAAKKNSFEGRIDLGIIYREGLGVAVSIEEAIKWLSPLAEKEPLAASELALAYADQKDFKLAATYFQHAIKKSTVEYLYQSRSYIHLAKLYLYGLGVAGDKKQAIELLQTVKNNSDLASGFLCLIQNMENESPTSGAYTLFASFSADVIKELGKVILLPEGIQSPLQTQLLATYAKLKTANSSSSSQKMLLATGTGSELQDKEETLGLLSQQIKQSYGASGPKGNH